MELISYFHDHIIILLLMVLVFVSYLFIAILLFTSHRDRMLVDSHFLELI